MKPRAMLGQRQPTLAESDSYKDASKRLRKQLRDTEAYAAANAWALNLCNEVKQTRQWSDQHEISQQERQYLRDWTAGVNAALFLARHLDAGDWDGSRVDEAARQAGVPLIPDSKEAGDANYHRSDEACLHKVLRRQAFTEVLRELAKQPVGSHQRASSRGRLFVCGPLLVIPPGKRLHLPSESESLAIALIYGFRRMTGAIERNPSKAGHTPTSATDDCFRGLYANNNEYRRFDLLSGGKPCHEAAVLFANATFDTEEEASTIIDWLKRNGRRAYVLMGDKIKG
jgi:hypothetical protein